MSSLLNPSENVCQDSCDICEDEKPQWYCAADEAYLCDDCDLSVHGVNSLALTHERVTLNCSDYEVAHVPHSSPGANDFLKIKHEHSNIYDSCRNMKETASLQKPKKDRSTDESLSATSSTQDSYVKNGGITYTRATKVELDSQFQEEHRSYDFSMGYHKYWKSSDCLFVYEGPVLVPVAQEMPTMNRQDAPKQVCPSCFGATNLEESSTCDFMEFLVPEICDVDNYIISNTDSVGNEEETSIVKAEEAVAGNEPVEEKMCCQLKGNESALEFSLSNKTQQSILHDHYERYYDQTMNDIRLEYLELNVLKRSRDTPKANCTETFVPLAKVCEKLKVEYTEEADQIGQHLEALIEQSFHIISKEARNQKSFKEARNQKSFLRLNYEDVVSAWSDRGCFWTDGQWPRTIPPDSTSNPLEEASLDVGIVPDLEAESMKSPEQKDDDGREARVLRYREKRQTRLFSKKVRYEVRKLNAEKRPRVKGRFVKRSS